MISDFFEDQFERGLMLVFDFPRVATALYLMVGFVVFALAVDTPPANTPTALIGFVTLIGTALWPLIVVAHLFGWFGMLVRMFL